MSIQTEYMSFNNCWMISSCYDFQAHQQRFQRRWYFSRLLYCDLRCSHPCHRRFRVLPALSSTLRGAPRLSSADARRVVITPRCSQVHRKFLLALQGVPKLITITPIVLLYQSSGIPGTPKAGCNALYYPEIDASRFTHHSLSDTPADS